MADVTITKVEVITPDFAAANSALKFNYTANGKKVQIAYRPDGTSDQYRCPTISLDDVVGLNQAQLKTAMELIVEHALNALKAQQEA